MLSRTRDFCRRVAGCVRTFPTWADYRTFRRCERAGVPADAVALRVRGVPSAVWCRPGTTDAAVLYETFAGGYHLPPVRLPGGAVVLDLGANVGHTAVDFAARYPTARVIAVEMDGGNCGVARRNVTPFGGRVEVVEAAVWDEDGEIEYGGDAAWGLHVEAGGGRRAAAVNVGTLMDRHRVGRAHYVKMDIEGAEARVIGPHAAWLQRVDAIQVEVHAPATPEAVMAALRGFGFACHFGRRGVVGTRA